METEAAVKILRKTYYHAAQEEQILVDDGREACRMGAYAIELLAWAELVGAEIKKTLANGWYVGVLAEVEGRKRIVQSFGPTILDALRNAKEKA